MELGLSNGSSSDFGPVLGAKETVADLVPKGIRLLKVPVKVIESNFQVEENANSVFGGNSVSVPVEVTQVHSNKGRKTQVAVGCDRAQRAAPQLLGRAKALKKIKRSKSCGSRLGSEMNGIVGNSAMGPFSSSHSDQNKELKEEAVKVLEFGKSVITGISSRHLGRSWIKQVLGTLKFNVVASSRGGYGVAGSGGILRNHNVN
ncbi:hypothetical protein V6N12_020172 [Hibiscus sabdariffa]|uniref:Uncharacterized protein n=1 Tax=Hibiscus sabdariffa TaxID=183260 RepID=A0ABR2ANH0_9ROSI